MRPQTLIGPQCERCGACCSVFNFVELSKTDRGRIPLSCTETYPNEPWTRVMKRKDGTCGELAMVDGKANCVIYGIRPEICRAFQPGCDLCLAAKDRFKKLNTLVV